MIEIKYDGKFPKLCSADLVVIIDGKQWDFGRCLSSGGSVWFDKNYSQEHVKHGPWHIRDWPAGFPNEQKDAVLDAVNKKIPYGCCGGCV